MVKNGKILILQSGWNGLICFNQIRNVSHFILGPFNKNLTRINFVDYRRKVQKLTTFSDEKT